MKKLVNAVAAVSTLLLFALNIYVIRAVYLSYCEEKAHAEFLYDCTHMQRPNACENVWQSQYAHKKPPWEP